MSLTANASTYWLAAARVIVSFKPLLAIADAAVRVSDGKIDWVGRRTADRPDEREPLLDLGAATLMPGLLESHAHLSFNAGSDPVGDTLSSSARQRHQLIVANGQRFLDSGVTTVRDLGSPQGSVLEVRDAILDGSVVGPTILAADQPITRFQGHLWRMAAQVTTRRELELAIQTLAAVGANVCKIMVTGGRMTPGTDPQAIEIPLDILSAATKLAHAEGMSVAAHCLSTGGVIAAAEARVDTIEHGTFIDSGDVPHDEAATIDIAKRLADNGVAVCPTLNARHRGSHPIGFEQRARWIRLLAENDVDVILGNDAGIPSLPPELYLGGLEAFLAADFSHASALHAATAGAAKALGVAASVGTLESGKRADVIAVAGNPLEDIECLTHPLAVVARGKLVASERSLSTPTES